MIPEERLCAAAAGSCEAYVSYLEREVGEDGPWEFSAAFEKKIARLKRRADHPVFYPALRRIAAVLLALLAVGAAWIAMDKSARAGLFGWIGEDTGPYFHYHYEGKISGSAESAEFRPAWLPEGYGESGITYFDTKTTVKYTNEQGRLLRFSYQKQDEDMEWALSTAGTELYETEVNGYPATLLHSVTETVASAVTWIGEGDVVFFVSGFVSDEDLLRMAESVAPLEKPVICRPMWLPKGYEERNVTAGEDGISVTFLNWEDTALTFDYLPHSGGRAVFPGETDSAGEETLVGDAPALLFLPESGDAAGSILWTDGADTAFRVSGCLSEEELLRIAESVRQVSVYRPTRLPEGCRPMFVTQNEYRTIVRFSVDGEGSLLFSYMPASGDAHLFVDIENAETRDIFVNQFPAVLYVPTNDDGPGISWTGEDEMLFFLTGHMGEHELLRIAESVRLMYYDAWEY